MNIRFQSSYTLSLASKSASNTSVLEAVLFVSRKPEHLWYPRFMLGELLGMMTWLSRLSVRGLCFTMSLALDVNIVDVKNAI